jgi:hypothetical protein
VRAILGAVPRIICGTPDPARRRAVEDEICARLRYSDALRLTPARARAGYRASLIAALAPETSEVT